MATPPDHDPAALAPERMQMLLAAGRRASLHIVARDVWPSFSGTDEVVALVVTRRGAAWQVTGEVLPDQFGVRAERFEADLDDAGLGGLLRRVLDSERPSLRWGL
jgi:hypothetical protein